MSLSVNTAPALISSLAQPLCFRYAIPMNCLLEHMYEERGLEEFFKVSLDAPGTYDVFDSLGHLDTLSATRLTNALIPMSVSASGFGPLILMELTRECHGKVAECTPGPAWPCTAQSLLQILKRYRELGGEIINIGSDAHTPDHLGYGFQECRRFLLRCGFRYYTMFHGRKPEFSHYEPSPISGKVLNRIDSHVFSGRPSHAWPGIRVWGLFTAPSWQRSIFSGIVPMHLHCPHSTWGQSLPLMFIVADHVL